MEHDVVPLGERHAPHNFEYADETARLAATITDSKWVNALALQLDDGSYWRVASVSPATWEPSSTPAWGDLTGKPSTFPPSTHSHAISDVTDLQDELDAKEPSIPKATGYAKWTGSAWSFANENYMQTSHAANGIAGSDIANWNTAFGWGDHSSAGYQASLGYTPENAANKSTNATTDAASNTKYPSVKAIVDYAVAADASVLSSAATDATTKANAAQAAAIAASTPVSHLGSGGAAHANVVAAGAAGFMSGADKTKLDAITGANSGDETGARIATLHHAASAKTTLVDADELTGQNSAAGFGLIRVTWANIKATLATWIGGGTIAGSFTTLAASGNTTLGDAEATDTHAVKGATTVLANSASAALTVTQTGAGNAFVVEDSASTDSTPVVIDGNGFVNIGHTASIADVFGESTLQVRRTDGNLSSFSNYANDNNAGIVYFNKARGGSITTPTVLSSGDTVSSLLFSGYDGAAFKNAAEIKVFIDGTPGLNDMPGRLVFSTTADGASTPTERMRIDSSGNVLVTNPAGLGYGTGAGGTVTQATSRTTGVTLSKPTGKITLFSTTATTGTFASFTLTNTLIAATDVVIVNFASATSANKYSLFVTAVDAGSCRIQVYNIAAVAVAEAPVINFAVIKGATS